MCTFEHYPFESPLHEIYKDELCISPIPSIAIHCTNVNSIFGLSSIIKYNYGNSMTDSYLPFKIRLFDLNLFYNVHITKIN